jgi:hypothetical protein
MVKSVVTLFCFIFCFALKGQDKPVWIESDMRSAKYPKDVFITGFAQGNPNSGETVEKAIERIKTTAQSNLLESIRVSMQSQTSSSSEAISINNSYEEIESFNNHTSKDITAEITGMKVESYFNKKTNYIHAFAYANKYELIGYYKSNLTVNIGQLESFVETAQDLEASNEKAKARQQLELAKPLFDKARYAQDLLTAIDIKIAAEDLQQAKTETLYNTFSQLQARLDIKYEKIDNLKNSLIKNITQMEGYLQTSKDLEMNGEKPKARQQCEEAKLLLVKMREIQDSLFAIEPKITSENLQQAKTEQLYNEITQMSARLVQATLVYVENNEDLFGKDVDIVSNKLKSELAVKGCSFVDNAEKADFLLRVKASARESSTNGNIVFCYADVAVELYDTHKQKSVYSNEVSQKGSSSSKEKAGIKALSDVVPKIAEELKTWIE